MTRTTVIQAIIVPLNGNYATVHYHSGGHLFSMRLHEHTQAPALLPPKTMNERKFF